MGASYATVAMIMVALLAASAMPAAMASAVGTASIAAPAVLLYNNTGAITIMSLSVTTGNGMVSISGPKSVGNDTLQSAITAAAYAANVSGVNASRYDFLYSINDTANVTGPSGGAALTLLAISAIQHKPILKDIAITGTISPGGYIGEIGGAYDKAGAAASYGLKAILVPYAGFDSFEEKEYLIAQSYYRIPLIQVENISQAEAYAFGSKPITGAGTNYSMEYGYNTSALQNAAVSCSNNCSEAPFYALGNYTMNITASQISNRSIAALPGVGAQFSQALAQSHAIYSKGYLYAGSDLAFLDYVNAYMFGSFNSSRAEIPVTMQNIQNSCESLSAPQLTVSNYEYIIAAEMRQGWGNYSISGDINSYNVSQTTSDEVLGSAYLAGESNAWCAAASFLYGYNYTPSQYLVPSKTLSSIAAARIKRALPYGSMYLNQSNESYAQHNYPVAIMDADYAYAFGSSAAELSKNASYLDSHAAAMAANATYGAWATEFSNEAMFYVAQSRLADNSTASEGYAQQAYTVGLLAAQISNDTRIIYDYSARQAPSVQPGTGTANSSPETALALAKLAGQLDMALTLMLIIVVLLILNMVLLFMILTRRAAATAKGPASGKRTIR